MSSNAAVIGEYEPTAGAAAGEQVVAGSVIVWSAPAFTTGAVLVAAGFTITTTSSNADSALSLAVSRSVYVPGAENVAVVAFALGLANVTVPDPINSDQVVGTVAGGLGSPSSVTVPASSRSTRTLASGAVGCATGPPSPRRAGDRAT